MVDQMVLATQKWLNKTYGSNSGFGKVTESGHTGWNTIYGLIRGLQIELGITTPVDNFGPGTESRFKARWPHGISEQKSGATATSNVYGIIQGALWCKGYSTGGSGITTHFYDGTGSAIKKLKTDMGISGDSTVTLGIMKALLSMDQYVLLKSSGGRSEIRSIQQNINKLYRDYTGIVPTDGLYGRQMNVALIQILQKFEGYTPSQATGYFGDGTRTHLITVDSSNSINHANWVWLGSVMLICNGYNAAETTAFDTPLSTSLKLFQKDYALPVTGKFDRTTWMSLFVSKGDPDRQCSACDCATVLNAQQARDLKKAGYSYVGRYLTGTYGNNIPKALTSDETKNIVAAGLRVFPIYEDGGYRADYFNNAEQGTHDAYAAIQAAERIGVPAGAVIYFAVDFDAYGYQVSSLIIPYFQHVRMTFGSAANPKRYKVGIYAPRHVCTEVADAGAASASFVADMSSGFSGNLGYPIPKNWAFDQFVETSLASSPNFPIDRDAASGRDKGIQRFDTVASPSVPQSITNEQRESARQDFIEKVLKPMDLFSDFLSVDWSYGKEIQISSFVTPLFEISCSVLIDSRISSPTKDTTVIHISTDSKGNLSASTEADINAWYSKNALARLSGEINSEKAAGSIALSVKQGNLLISLEKSGLTGISSCMTLQSGNLTPSAAIETFASVSVIWSFTLLGGKYHFDLQTVEKVPEEAAAFVSMICMKISEMLHNKQSQTSDVTEFAESLLAVLCAVGIAALVGA